MEAITSPTIPKTSPAKGTHQNTIAQMPSTKEAIALPLPGWGLGYPPYVAYGLWVGGGGGAEYL